MQHFSGLLAYQLCSIHDIAPLYFEAIVDNVLRMDREMILFAIGKIVFERFFYCWEGNVVPWDIFFFKQLGIQAF